MTDHEINTLIEKLNENNTEMLNFTDNEIKYIRALVINSIIINEIKAQQLERR